MTPNTYYTTKRCVNKSSNPYISLSTGLSPTSTLAFSLINNEIKSNTLVPLLSFRVEHLPSNDPGSPPKLLDQVRYRIRRLGMAKRTEYAYVGWIRRFVLANNKRHPAELGKREMEAFLTGIAVQDQVAPSTQNQALSALMFLYKEVLHIEVPWLVDVRRAKARDYLPVVLTRDETQALLGELSGVHHLAASLLYGTGMRLMECLRLRIKDLDFARSEITVRLGKGGKDRRTLFPESLQPALRSQMRDARQPCGIKTLP